MSHIRSLLPAIALALALPSPALAATLSGVQLQAMVSNMGYAPNVLSKPGEALKFEITTKAGTFTVPISFDTHSDVAAPPGTAAANASADTTAADEIGTHRTSRPAAASASAVSSVA